MEDFKGKVSTFDDLKLQHEKVNQELEYANQRIKELEFEIASYKDWKEITKVTYYHYISVQGKYKTIY